MGILKYHQTSLVGYERGWPLACLEDLIKPNQASHQGARWISSVSMLKVPVLTLIIETSAVWPWCSRSFQDICRGLCIIIAELTCGLFPMIFRMVFPSCRGGGALAHVPGYMYIVVSLRGVSGNTLYWVLLLIWCEASGNALYWVLLLVYVGPRATHFNGYCCCFMCLGQHITWYCCWFMWGLGQHTLLGIVGLCGTSGNTTLY
jgi:hypothetical protein